MRVFEKFPEHGVCPVCGTNQNAQTILVPIDDFKNKDSNTVEAIPTHLSCIVSNIRYSKSHQLMGLEAIKGPKA
jgi:hypothetical protein